MEPHQVDQFLSTINECTTVVGLPEDTVAMLFGKFSRSELSFRDSLIQMVDDGVLKLPTPPGGQDTKTRQFHERITIGYNHKSVGDHAMVHFCVEGVSALVERDFTSARLIAASSKSTRFVNFRDAGFVVPPMAPPGYQEHCLELLAAYEHLGEVLTDELKRVVPYEGSAKEIWRKESGWESAIQKRALDAVRDLLPMSIKTSFGMTMSATGLREFLDKREEDDDALDEIVETAGDLRRSAMTAIPVLLPQDSRHIPRSQPLPSRWCSRRVGVPLSVKIHTIPNWHVVETITGQPLVLLVNDWTHNRARHMVPDRNAELAEYIIELEMPIAIHRDLGRHRMMTQLWSAINPTMGYGNDPIFSDHALMDKFPRLRHAAMMHTEMLRNADARLIPWMTKYPEAISYACPLATRVRVVWKLSARELVHILGLRTTPQGHPSYRALVQGIAAAIKHEDPIITGLVDEVTNYDNVLVGRPG